MLAWAGCMKRIKLLVVCVLTSQMILLESMSCLILLLIATAKNKLSDLTCRWDVRSDQHLEVDIGWMHEANNVCYCLLFGKPNHSAGIHELPYCYCLSPHSEQPDSSDSSLGCVKRPTS